MTNSNISPRVHRAVNILQWVVILCTVFAIGDAWSPYGLSYNPSPSLPLGLYWDTPVPRELHRGELACFPYVPPVWAAARDYLPPAAQICKIVMGVAGDHILRNGRSIFICHQGSCISGGLILKADSKGRPAVPAALPSVIPAGEYYMGSTRVPNSFDSRYLGLIPYSSMTRAIHPVITESW